MACFYFYNGKWHTRESMLNVLKDGTLERLHADGKINIPSLNDYISKPTEVAPSGNIAPERVEVPGRETGQNVTQIAPENLDQPAPPRAETGEATQSEVGNIYYHGSDKTITGSPKTGRVETMIKTQVGGIPFKDLWDAFYVTKDKEWAKFFSPKKSKVYEVRISNGAKILDLSDIAESTHLKNKPLLGDNIKKSFPFQKEFEEYGFNWLNSQRIKNGKTPLLREEFYQKELDKSFDPSTKEWWLDGFGQDAFVDYVKDNGYDAVKFGREIAVLNPSVSEFVKDKKISTKPITPAPAREAEAAVTNTQTPPTDGTQTEEEGQRLQEVTPPTAEQPGAEQAVPGATVSPNKEVKVNQQVAIKEVISALEPKLNAMDGGFLFQMRNGKPVEQSDDGLRQTTLTKLYDLDYVDMNDDWEYVLTDKGQRFIDRVNARLGTRRAVKAGTDMFPELANIPEYNEKINKIKETKTDITNESIKRIADQDTEQLRIIAEDIERKAESDNEAELAEAVRAADEVTATPAPEQTVGDKIKAAANNLRTLKIDKGLNEPTTFGISDIDLWNQAIDIAADVLETTGDVVQAVADGLRVIKNKDDRKRFKEAILKATGGAQPVTDGDDLTKTRHADTQQMREDAGIGEYERNPQKLADIEAEAVRQINAGYNVAPLLDRIFAGAAINPVEHRIIANYVLGLRAKLKDNPTPELEKEYETSLQANDIANSQSGRALRSINHDWNPEDNAIDMIIENKNIIGADQLTEEQQKQNRAEWEEIDSLKKQLQVKIAEAEKARAEAEAEKAIREQRKAYKSGARRTHEEYVAERQKIAKDIKDKWNKSRLNSMSSFVIPVPYANQLRAIAPDVLTLTKSYLAEGVDNLRDITAKIKSDLGIDEVTDTDIHNIIAGVYSEPREGRTGLATKLNNLKREAKDVTELDNLLNGRQPVGEKAKIKHNKKISETRKRINELRRAQGLGPFSEEARIQAAKARMLAEIDKIEQQLKSTEPIKTKRPEPLKLDKEGQQIYDKLIDARQRRKARMLREKYDTRSAWSKAGKFIMDLAVGSTRGAMATADVSMALLQNGVMALTHPVYWSNAFAKSIRDMVNEKAYNRWMDTQQSDRRFHIAKQSGLSVTDPKNQDLREAEELFMGNMLDRIPAIGKPIRIAGRNYLGITQASSRVFSSMSNRIRINMMYDLIDLFESQGKTLINSPELYKATARLINAGTGRAKYGKWENDAKILSYALWSPRMYASQIELLTAPINRYYWKAPRAVQLRYLRDAATFVSVSLGVLALFKMSGGEVEDDPRSKNFGKARIGNTWIGLPGGMMQWLILLTQMKEGQTKSPTTGKVRDLGPGFGETSRSDLMLRFIRGKMSPLVAMGWDMMDGRTYMGEDILTPEHLAQYTMPISIRSAIETARNEDVATGIWTGVLGSTGLPVQTYSPTGVYPTKDYGDGKDWFNALGEEKGKYDKAVWDFMAKNRIDVTPPNKSSLKFYDPNTERMVEFDGKKYSNFVKARGTYFKDAMRTIQSSIEKNKQEYIDRIMDTKFAGGELAVPNKAAAEEIFAKIIVPRSVDRASRRANEYGKDVVIGEQPSKTEIDIIAIIKEFSDHVEGK